MCDGGFVEISVVKMYCVCEAFVDGGFYVTPMRTIVFSRYR